MKPLEELPSEALFTGTHVAEVLAMEICETERRCGHTPQELLTVARHLGLESAVEKKQQEFYDEASHVYRVRGTLSEEDQWNALEKMRRDLHALNIWVDL